MNELDKLHSRVKRLERFNRYRWVRRAYYIASIIALLWMAHQWWSMHMLLDEVRRRVIDNATGISTLHNQMVGLTNTVHSVVVKVNGITSHTVNTNTATSVHSNGLHISGTHMIAGGLLTAGFVMTLFKFAPVLAAAI